MNIWKFKGVIFDLDGTLIDSSYIWKDIDIKFLGKRGFDVPEDYCRKISVLNFREGARYTISRFGLTESEDEIIKEWHDMAIYEYSHNIRLKKGAAEFLRLLKQRGVKICLATASSPELYTVVLRNNDVLEYFDDFAATQDVCRNKEFADVYLYAAGKIGVDVRECVVFEDLVEGVRSAKAAGFAVVGSLDEGCRKDWEEIRQAADDVVEDFAKYING